MRHHRTALPLAGYTLQQIDFDPATFQPEDLFWLPHHTLLADCARKRQTEHLAGRMAAVYALREVGEKTVPAIGDLRQPLWPTPWYGSISHCEHRALAVVSAQPVGLDIERIMAPAQAAELESSIINSEEKRRLDASGLGQSSRSVGARPGSPLGSGQCPAFGGLERRLGAPRTAKDP